MDYEKALNDEGFFLIAGVDEVGRGAWAGPVAAGAVILPTELDSAFFARVRDSKTLSASQRAGLAQGIRQRARSSAVGFASCAEIDEMGILPATRLAMSRAIHALAIFPDALLIDFVRLSGIKLRQSCPAHGDRDSLSIAAASILAKTARDEWMQEVAERAYPAYGFAKHKGYGTKAHQAALERWGATPIHRMSYAPVQARLF